MMGMPPPGGPPRMGPGPGNSEKGFGYPLDDMLMSIRQDDVPFFLFQNPHFIEASDMDKAKQSIIGIAQNAFITAVLGITLNLQIQKVPKLNFLSWPKPVRWLCRPLILTVPYLAYTRIPVNENVKALEDIHVKYLQRIKLFQRTGERRAIDPQNQLMEQFQNGGMGF